VSTRKLGAREVRVIADAENRVQKLDAALKAAKRDREEVRARYRDRITEFSEEKDDAGKDVRVAVAGGYLVRVTRFMGAQRFGLRGYLEAGHKITAAMREHLSEPEEQERWTVKNLAGPPKPGSVEPA